MGGGIRVNPETRVRVNRLAYKTGMLAQKLHVPTFYKNGADVIGIAGKLLINGYDAGKIRQMIDQTLRCHAWGYSAVVHGQRQHGTLYNCGDSDRYASAMQLWDEMQLRDASFYGILTRKGIAYGPFVTTVLQKGKTANFDGNGKYAGKPIENGTKFEKQPNMWNQVKKQDDSRYKIAMTLAQKLNPYNWLMLLLANYHADHARKISAANLGSLVGLQKGKAANLDGNGKYAGKPIENGTPFVDKK
jgi:hypothetical protein